jgi:outer membrane protein OmpA-like peptidoglycan-associated protein
MKQKLTMVLALALLVTGAVAQVNSVSPDKKPSLFGIHLNAVDFVTPETFNNNNTERKLAGLRDMDFGLSLSYWRGLTNTIDFAGKFNATLRNYAGARGESTAKTEAGLELEPTLNFRPFSDKALINPFLTAGIGAGLYTGKFSGYVPAGVGIQVNFNSVAYLMLQSNYRWSLDKDVMGNHIMHSIGIAHNFGPEKPKVVPPPPMPVVLDRDNDGIPDATDKCPDTPGLSSLQGCPDKDGDGIADADDKCPDVRGLAKYQGCPIPDTDKDGINDEEDKCPTVAGLVKYQGCPMPDQDNDGVADENDKCPINAGPASNEGCPEVSKDIVNQINNAAKNIVFATGSYKILPKSYKSLDVVAELMKQDESLTIDIDGYTDDAGDDASNQILSERRATSVKEYLRVKGVSPSRMASAGYGEARPVGDNKTAAGRAQNRRIEITAKN